MTSASIVLGCCNLLARQLVSNDSYARYRPSFSDLNREYVSDKQRGPMQNRDDIMPKEYKTTCQMLAGILSDIDRTPIWAMFDGMCPKKYGYQPGTFIPGSCTHPSLNIIWTHTTVLSLHEQHLQLTQVTTGMSVSGPIDEYFGSLVQDILTDSTERVVNEPQTKVSCTPPRYDVVLYCNRTKLKRYRAFKPTFGNGFPNTSPPNSCLECRRLRV